MERSPLTTPRALLLLGGVEAVALVLLAWWPGPAVPWPGMIFFFSAFGAWVGASLLGIRFGSPGLAPSSGSEVGAGGPVGGGSGPGALERDSIHRVLIVVWGVAVLLRLGLLPVAPELSDDVFRYLWDGHVQLQGVNPYLHAPADPALTGIRTSWHPLINHPEISTIYPPAAQMAFFVIALLGGGILQAKLLWIGLDLLTGWVLFRVAGKTGRNPVRVLILYLWCPLLVVETAWSAHLEPLGLLALALLLLFEARPTPAGIAGAGAALTKFAPVAALPPLLRRLGPRFGAAFVATVAVTHLPYLDAGSGLWDGLFTYVRDWRFMVGPFAILEAVFPGRWPPRIAAGVIVGSVVAWATWRRFSPERSLFWIMGAGLLLSPTIHPWYVLWILPFAALRASGPWLLLCGLVFLGYWGLAGFQESGVWPQPTWLRILVWTPPVAWLALQGIGLISGNSEAAEHLRHRKTRPAQGQVSAPEQE